MHHVNMHMYMYMFYSTVYYNVHMVTGSRDPAPPSPARACERFVSLSAAVLFSEVSVLPCTIVSVIAICIATHSSTMVGKGSDTGTGTCRMANWQFAESETSTTWHIERPAAVHHPHAALPLWGASTLGLRC